jgi:hypothetical protein
MRVYAALIATLVACRVALSYVPLDFKTPGQQLMLEWWFVPAIAVYGALGVLLLRRTGFPGAGTTRTGAMAAALHGLLLGLATVAYDFYQPARDLHHPLPEGILFYWYGGVVSEIWFHLLPVPLFVFVLSNLFLRGRHQEAAFWMALVLLSAWESRRGFMLIPYLANASEIWLFRRFGFTAAVAQRMVIYAVWHIAWPAMGTGNQ